jgi:hypothetical protein
MAHAVEPEDEAGMKIKQKRAMPANVIETRDLTLSAGVVAFHEVLVKQFNDLVAQARGDAEQVKPEAVGEDGPVVGPATAQLPLDDGQEKGTVRRRGH